MGNCCSIKKMPKFAEIISTQLTTAIEKNNSYKIKELINKYSLSTMNIEPILNINKPIVKLYSNDMNALGYALFLGFTESFIVILEVGRAKISVMNKMFEKINKRPIDIICELGHLKLLEYYLPFFLNHIDEVKEDHDASVSLSFTRPKNIDKIKDMVVVNQLPAIQKACEKERLNVIQYLYDNFKDKPVPNDFNVHYQDENTGENCALISCKTGNLEIMKYLFNVCQADFTILNKRRESAMQIMAVNSKKRPEIRFLDCFKFLIEVINIDYTYELEETLLILQDKLIIKYLEDRLRNEGYSINKSKLEDKYSLSKNRVPPAVDQKLEMKLGKIKGPRFNFKELFKQELQDSNEEISSIQPEASILSVSQISFINAKDQ